MAGGSTPGQPVAAVKLKRLIELGMQGKDVKACKRAAARAGFPKELLAGITDTYTQDDFDNIEQFQQAKNLTVDGKIGQETLDALGPSMDALALSWYDSFAPAVYVNPLRDAHDLVPLRTDQGVDYMAKRGSAILAMGRATITRSTTDSHWCKMTPPRMPTAASSTSSSTATTRVRRSTWPSTSNRSSRSAMSSKPAT
jgi:hypothetical protein